MEDKLTEEQIQKKTSAIMKERELFLQSENMFELIKQEISKKVEGEQDSIHTIFLCSCGRLVKNNQTASYNLLINDVSGAGKDFVTRNTLNIWQEEVRHYKNKMSPAAFTYWKRRTKLQEKEGVPEWDWDGHILNLEDVSNTLLNSDVFKVMCSSGSDAVIVKEQRAVEIKIKGKPVMIISSASAVPKPELVRRFSILNLDSGNIQTRNILKRQAAAAAEGRVIEYDNEISRALALLARYKVKIPFGNLIEKHVPDTVNMRTHFPRLLDYIKASCALYQFQRQKDGDFLIADKQDYEIARKAILKTTSNKFMIPLTKSQKEILEIMNKQDELFFTVNEILSKQNVYSSAKSLIKVLDKLTELGLLEREFDKVENYNKEVKHYSKKNEFMVELPRWEDL